MRFRENINVAPVIIKKLNNQNNQSSIALMIDKKVYKPAPKKGIDRSLNKFPPMEIGGEG